MPIVIVIPSLNSVYDWIDEETEGVVRYLKASVREYPSDSQVRLQLIVGRFQDTMV